MTHILLDASSREQRPHSSVDLARTVLFMCTGFLTLVILIAGAISIYFALGLDRSEAKKAKFLVEKAVE